jgi:PKD repeat protein
MDNVLMAEISIRIFPNQKYKSSISSIGRKVRYVSNKDCKPLNVTFTSFVGANATIQWDFGDGNTDTGYTVTHMFDTAGTFIIRQSVDNFCGFDSISHSITVLPQPDLSFIISPINCTNEAVTKHLIKKTFTDAPQKLPN